MTLAVPPLTFAVVTLAYLVTPLLFAHVAPKALSDWWGLGLECRAVDVRVNAHDRGADDVELGVIADNDCVLVTGASAGIGAKMMPLLVREFKAKLIVTGRTREKVVDAARRELGTSAMVHVALASALELANASSVAAFAAQVHDVVRDTRKCPTGKLAVVFLQAGMTYAAGWNGTSRAAPPHDNLDLVFASNYVGNVELLVHLSPLIRASKARVVLSSSAMSLFNDPPRVGMFAPNMTNAFVPASLAGAPTPSKHEYVVSKPLSREEAENPVAGLMYGTSKLALAALGFELRFKLGVDARVMTPGLVETSVWDGGRSGSRGGEREGKPRYWPFSMTPDEGAWYTVASALVPSAELDNHFRGTGELPMVFPYVLLSRVSFAPHPALNPDAARPFERARFITSEWAQHLTRRAFRVVYVCPGPPLASTESFLGATRERFLRELNASFHRD